MMTINESLQAQAQAQETEGQSDQPVLPPLEENCSDKRLFQYVMLTDDIKSIPAARLARWIETNLPNRSDGKIQELLTQEPAALNLLIISAVRNADHAFLQKLLNKNNSFINTLLHKRPLNLSGANLSNAFLLCTDLSGANLSGANLSGADLTRADLTKVNLTNANLSNTILHATKLCEANLSGTHLSGTYLFMFLANLSGADLSDVDLSDIDLSRAHCENAKFNEGTQFPKTLDKLPNFLPYSNTLEDLQTALDNLQQYTQNHQKRSLIQQHVASEISLKLLSAGNDTAKILRDLASSHLFLESQQLTIPILESQQLTIPTLFYRPSAEQDRLKQAVQECSTQRREESIRNTNNQSSSSVRPSEDSHADEYPVFDPSSNNQEQEQGAKGEQEMRLSIN